MTTKSTKTNHYTYIIRHINGKYYVGRRSTKRDPLLVLYMGSGNWVKSIKDKSTLSKEIIAYYSNSDELKVGEMELIEKYFLDEYCMNVSYSSCGASSESMSGVNNPMFGRTHTKKARKKISDAKSGDKHPQYGKRGEETPMYGKIGELSPRFGVEVSKETKKKMSDNHAVFSGENHPSATITEAVARLIKIRISERVGVGVGVKLIAEEYNTTVSIVNNIKYGRSWKHIII